MGIVLRPARMDDLVKADELVVDSINNLTERRGFGRMGSSHPPNFQAFCLRDDAAGLWVAEDEGKVIGFAWSWVCGELWFLAQLFVAPGRQNDGIGNQLIARTFAHATTRGSSIQALITFSFNNVSQGLYIRHGLYPRFPIYMVSVPRNRLTRPRGPLLDLKPLTGASADFDELDAIDLVSLGISRSKHHKYLLSDRASNGFTIHVGKECTGYFYISDGHIGPLAVRRPNLIGSAFATALSLGAQSNSSNVSAFLPGVSEAALKVAVAQRMQITMPMLLMSDRHFGDWTSYLPRNPGFM